MKIYRFNQPLSDYRNIMKLKLISIICFLSLFQSIAAAGTSVVTSAKQVNVAAWINRYFGKGKEPPFSFTYGGKASSQFIRTWKYQSRKVESGENGVVEYIFTYTEPKSGLTAECAVKGFQDFGAVEWLLSFVNNGSMNTPEISNVSSSDVTFKVSKPELTKLYYANGSSVSKTDFAPHEKTFAVGDSLTMKPKGGRSSDSAFPFFNIELRPDNGVMCSIGWTGTWFATMKQQQVGGLRLTTGLNSLKTYLLPGERIRTSRFCMLFWHGKDRFAGHNQFRRFLLAHHTWKTDGKPTVYPISTGFNYGDPAPCNEYTCMTEEYAIALVKRYEKFHLVPDVFWLDAGWYSHSDEVENNKYWWNTVGEWTVDEDRFPHGLKPVADEVHRAGAKFLLWFEPERVRKGTKFYKEHPTWLLDPTGKNDYAVRDTDRTRMTFLFNLGNKEACEWLGKYIVDFMKTNGVDYYRQDFNIAPEGFWRANDEPGREGMTEVKYIEGLYDFWHYILMNVPGVLIDNCASGGRRLDLETVSMSAPLWRSDYHYGEPDGCQNHTYGLELYLPLHGTAVYVPQNYELRSSMGSSMICNWKITEKNYSLLDEQNMLKQCMTVRPYFYDDYYPLGTSGAMAGDDIWMAYQLNNAADNSGYVVAFRRQKCAQSTFDVSLHAMNPDAVYVVTDCDSNVSTEMSGSELSAKFTLKADKPRSSVLIKYQIKK